MSDNLSLTDFDLVDEDLFSETSVPALARQSSVTTGQCFKSNINILNRRKSKSMENLAVSNSPMDDSILRVECPIPTFRGPLKPFISRERINIGSDSATVSSGDKVPMNVLSPKDLNAKIDSTTSKCSRQAHRRGQTDGNILYSWPF